MSKIYVHKNMVRYLLYMRKASLHQIHWPLLARGKCTAMRSIQGNGYNLTVGRSLGYKELRETAEGKEVSGGSAKAKGFRIGEGF